MKLNLKTIRKIYKLKNIVRYNTHSKLVNETVAEHSFYVALFTMELCKILKLTEQQSLIAIQLAILHDVPEMITNDITYDAKQAMPEINKTLSKYERRFYEDNYADYEELFDNSVDVQLGMEIVKLADILSAIQYCDNEVQLGNKYFEHILKGNIKRFERQKEFLERRGINCQEIII